MTPPKAWFSLILPAEGVEENDMRKRIFAVVVVMAWALAASVHLPFSHVMAATKKPAAKKAAAEPPDPPLKLKVGDVAPDFVLLAFDGKDLKKVSLQDFHGKKNVALAFYVFAFTGG